MVRGKESTKQIEGHFIRPYSHGFVLETHYRHIEGKNAGSVTVEQDAFFASLRSAALGVLDKRLHINFNAEDVLAAIEKSRVETLAVVKEFDVSYKEAYKVFYGNQEVP